MKRTITAPITAISAVIVPLNMIHTQKNSNSMIFSPLVSRQATLLL
ncbi:MAG: hypothetical protein HFH19_03510 [Ruminococcus sp.]|nr:hypothetical protein [Ruminococcus sp.]